MSRQDQFNRIVTALHDAALNDMVWPGASRLIDEAVGMAAVIWSSCVAIPRLLRLLDRRVVYVPALYTARE